MNYPFDDFTVQIQSDEIAARGDYPGGDWVNDFEDSDDEDHDGNIIDD